jgi:hypothetical protein
MYAFAIAAARLGSWSSTEMLMRELFSEAILVLDLSFLRASLNFFDLYRRIKWNCCTIGSVTLSLSRRPMYSSPGFFRPSAPPAPPASDASPPSCDNIAMAELSCCCGGSIVVVAVYLTGTMRTMIAVSTATAKLNKKMKRFRRARTSARSRRSTGSSGSGGCGGAGVAASARSVKIRSVFVSMVAMFGAISSLVEFSEFKYSGFVKVKAALASSLRSIL